MGVSASILVPIFVSSIVVTIFVLFIVGSRIRENAVFRIMIRTKIRVLTNAATKRRRTETTT